jgi:hypothetical protein
MFEEPIYRWIAVCFFFFLLYLWRPEFIYLFNRYLTHTDIPEILTRKVRTSGDILQVPTRKKAILGLGVRFRAGVRIRVRFGAKV